MRRHMLAVIAGALLLAGAATLFHLGFDEGEASMAASVCIRAGTVLGAIWLAFPQILQLFKKVSPVTCGILFVGALIVVARPRAILYVGPLLAAIALLQFVGSLFKPLPAQPPPRRPGDRTDKAKR